MILFFFFNDTATTEIYTLSLHDALPIYDPVGVDDLADIDRDGQPAHAHLVVDFDVGDDRAPGPGVLVAGKPHPLPPDRKSTRLNSSHANISYAGFCLKKKTLMSH